ncbi:unnamed protein product [Vicia faba]|uniref:Uncharacterized protein n=1 Tax=Vicia faba TaxID=3906 RepID=A0AAV0YMY3_VICFA|nr:unnamed protein product [Vicia faba]
MISVSHQTNTSVNKNQQIIQENKIESCDLSVIAIPVRGGSIGGSPAARGGDGGDGQRDRRIRCFTAACKLFGTIVISFSSFLFYLENKVRKFIN